MSVRFTVKGKNAYMECSDELLFNHIRNHFSTNNPAVAHSTSPHCPSQIYAMTPGGRFEPGMHREIRDYIVSMQFGCSIDVDPKFEQLIPKGFGVEVYDKLTFPLRPYQYDTVKGYIEHGCGVGVLGTGAGKTLISAALISSICKPTERCVVIVPDPGLAVQTYNDFVSYKLPLKCAIYGAGSIPDADAQVIICNHDIIAGKKRAGKSDWLLSAEYVIVDEIHTVKKGKTVDEFIRKFKTRHRFGMTGTLPTTDVDRWNIIGILGPVVYRKSSSDLRDEGFLTPAIVNQIEIQYRSIPKPPPLGTEINSTTYYTAELDFVYTNAFRNKIIAKLCKADDSNILILVNHLRHGKILKDLIELESPMSKVYFIEGAVDLVERERIKDIMKSGSNIKCIAMSSIFSTGISIDKIHSIIFASGGKSFVRVVQSIGRGLRKHISKQLLRIIDICDLLEYGILHAAEREKIYNLENIPVVSGRYVEK